MLALSAAVCWSVAVGPLALNQFKNIIALSLFTLSLLVTREPFFRDVPASDYVLLLVSGAIGIGLSDTLFFLCLNRIGAGLQAIVNTSYSPAIIILSLIFLGETLTLTQASGAVLIVGAVLAVSAFRGAQKGPQVDQRTRGILYGILATTTQGISIVMIKPQLDTMPLLWATWWRIVGGIAAVLLFLIVMPAQRRALVSLRDRQAWKVMIPGSVMGSFVAMLLWIGGMKYTQASIAAALNQTSTLWTFALAVLVLGEPTTRRRLIAVALGSIGVFLVTWR